MKTRKPGLWLPTVKVEVQTVTARHRKPCTVCGSPITGRRLMVRSGSGRSQTTALVCRACCPAWVDRREEELKRLLKCMAGADVSIRTQRVVGDPGCPVPKAKTSDGTARLVGLWRKAFSQTAC